MPYQCRAEARGVAILKQKRIRTTADLDAWIREQGIQTDKWGNRHYMSRAAALDRLVGEESAMWILDSLSMAREYDG